MTNRTFTDNWILQNVSELVMEGLSHEKSKYLKINNRTKSYNWVGISQAFIQIKCLFSLLHDIVLSDQILVDENFVSSWQRFGDQFDELIHSNALAKINFDTSNKNFLSIREYILNEICVNKGLLEMQRTNEKEWKEHGKSVDNLFSQIVWGGAGYLARSNFNKVPYSAHPLRKYIFSQTLFKEHDSSLDFTLNWIQKQRIKLFEKIYSEKEIRIGIIPLPPIIIEVIEESRTIDDIFTIALQLRYKYSKFRKWLTEYQSALNDENTNALIKHKKLLDSIATNISEKIGSAEYSKATVTLGTSWFSIPLNVDNPKEIRQKYGIRSILNKIILMKKGISTFNNFLKFFGEDKSKFGKEIEHNILTINSF
jgi:hypothetical protein